MVFEHVLGNGQLLRDEDTAHGTSQLAVGKIEMAIPKLHRTDARFQFITMGPRSMPEQQQFLDQREIQLPLREKQELERETPLRSAVPSNGGLPSAGVINRYGKRLGLDHYSTMRTSGTHTPVAKKQAPEAYISPWWMPFK